MDIAEHTSDPAMEESEKNDEFVPVETDVETEAKNEESFGNITELPQESRQSLEPLVIPTPREAETDDVSNATPAQAVAPTPTLLIPCLKGRLFVEGVAHICRGVWAMSEELHNQPGQVGDFEFRLVTPDASAAASAFPKNGKYQGWFSLKQPPPLKSTIKVDDRDMIMTFVQNEADEYIVQGEGVNKFGSFSLRGTLKADGTILMYRSYTTKPVVVKKRSVSPTKEKSAKKRQVTAESATPAASLESGTPATGRESVGRVRKAKSFGDEEMHAPTPHSGVPKTPRATAPAAAPAATKSAATKTAPAPPAAAPVNVSNRVQRVSLPLQKCADLLKELLKQPMAVWFATPVDHVLLNIPDYPTIITHPMDFSTVKANLDANKYSTPDEFAEHIRLIFRNAKTYNVSRENPVHIAAIDMGGRFEERFRSMMANLAQNPILSQALNLPDDSVPVAASSSKKGSSKAVARPSAAGAPLQRQLSSASVSSAKRALGPRVDSLVPAPLDVSAHMMSQMQKQMQEMQDEIMKLRTAVRVNDVQQQIISQRDAAQNPLTYEEKSILVRQIEQMEDDNVFQNQIADIIRTSSTYQPRDDAEVGIDELDTLTLRKIQKFVAENFVDNRALASPGKKSKKGPVAGKPAAAAAAKKGKAPAAAPAPVAYAAPAATYAPAAEVVSAPAPVVNHFAAPTQEEEEEMLESGDMLFEAESFEVLRMQAGTDGYASDDGSDMGEREENDDDVQGGVALSNADAWTRGATAPRFGANTTTTTSTTQIINKESNVWKEAASEMQAAREREENVRLEQARVAQLKATHDAQRLAQLQQQAVERSQQQERQEQDALWEAERSAEALRRQREEERSRLSNLSRTVHMDSHAEDEEMHMFVEGADV